MMYDGVGATLAQMVVQWPRFSRNDGRFQTKDFKKQWAGSFGAADLCFENVIPSHHNSPTLSLDAHLRPWYDAAWSY